MRKWLLAALLVWGSQAGAAPITYETHKVPFSSFYHFVTRYTTQSEVEIYPVADSSKLLAAARLTADFHALGPTDLYLRIFPNDEWYHVTEDFGNDSRIQFTAYGAAAQELNGYAIYEWGYGHGAFEGNLTVRYQYGYVPLPASSALLLSGMLPLLLRRRRRGRGAPPPRDVGPATGG